jgi:hypothetical protein
LSAEEEKRESGKFRKLRIAQSVKECGVDVEREEKVGGVDVEREKDE